ncbi:unnamed protein product [Chrysodeixis includens]|uniref:Natalisin n=1 Tax=Chrysodeixis includens TaxID=689277 RepID=A0A9P0BU30_CHRIL|nr:unnamed protein product [Chrysodeixis includens]
MPNKIQTFLLFFLIITTDIVVGKVNKTKANKKPSALKEKLDTGRVKRSLNDDDDRPFWSNRGKKQTDDQNYYNKYDRDYDNIQKFTKSNDKILKDQPFWGNRGRRENSMENLFGYPLEYPEFFQKYCEHCVDSPQSSEENRNLERRYDLISPFWGSRGRRNSMEIETEDDPFWGNRGRRQEQEPFWGNRGRRQENEPFWGNRGRRDDMDPFWGNRGRRDDSDPFWGNRGRREETEPFWGNRGRRQSDEPFWGNRGRRKISDPNWVRNRKEDLKESILYAINDVENDIENLSRLKKSNVDPNSFWAGRGRDNKLAILFNTSRGRASSLKTGRPLGKEPGTVLDNRMYVDEPNYILVERSGRSSAEIEDPYYISRGKKYYLNYSMVPGGRDRRGAIEEIVKSVRNDPYFIARGKKKFDGNNKNSTLRNEEYLKAKELICAAVDLIMIRADKGKVKREINDNDRDRRTILKKLAAQLQMDPYFVSRGKKNQITGDKDYLQEFISNVAEKCD